MILFLHYKGADIFRGLLNGIRRSVLTSPSMLIAFNQISSHSALNVILNTFINKTKQLSAHILQTSLLDLFEKCTKPGANSIIEYDIHGNNIAMITYSLACGSFLGMLDSHRLARL